MIQKTAQIRRRVAIRAVIAGFVLAGCGSSDASSDLDNTAEQNSELGQNDSQTETETATETDSGSDALACDLVTEGEVSEIVGFAVTAELIDLGARLGSNCNFDGSEGRVRIAMFHAQPGQGDALLEDAAKFGTKAGFDVEPIEGYGDKAYVIDGALEVLVGDTKLIAFTERVDDESVRDQVMTIMLKNL